MSRRERSVSSTVAMWAWVIPMTWAYGPARRPNWPSEKVQRRSSTATVLCPTVHSTTLTPRARSSGIRVASTFSMPP
jgi:hypothetical protein